MEDQHKKYTNVYIKNFGEELDDGRLGDMFEQHGKIISAKVMCNESGKSRGFGFVNFMKAEDAEKAVAALNGSEMGGKKLYCGPALKKVERQAEAEKIKLERINRYQGMNLYVKNLDAGVDDERLLKEFSQFGTITSAKVMCDKSGKSRGFGFVNFEEAEDAEKAMAALNDFEMEGKKLYCGPAQSKAERQVELNEKAEMRLEKLNRQRDMNLYLKNLEPSVDDEKLRNEFSQFGTITSVKVMSEHGRSRGFGFVCFSSPEEAEKARAKMDGHILEGKSLYVALAQRKEERRAQQASQHIEKMALMRYQQIQKIASMRQQEIQRMASMHQQNIQYPPIFNTGREGYFAPMMQQAQRDFFPFGAAHPSMAFDVINNQMAARTWMNQSVGPPAAYPSGPRQMSVPPVGPITQDWLRPQQSVLVPGQVPLTASMLAAAPPPEQKQMLGERLFPLIQLIHPDLAGKITGMLLEIDNSEILHMLESHESLKLKVEDTVVVLQDSQSREPTATKEEMDDRTQLTNPSTGQRMWSITLDPSD